jgi:glyoxylase-like metal-dependent hydrolase (beta-lactamase superfamily II)
VIFGSVSESVLFTGDHLAYSSERNGLDGFKSFNHGNIVAQAESIRLLADDKYPFKWILPGS